MLAGILAGKWEVRVGGGRVRLSNVDTGELVGLKNEMVCHFELATDVLGSGNRESVNDANRSAFLERELMEM